MKGFIEIKTNGSSCLININKITSVIEHGFADTPAIFTDERNNDGEQAQYLCDESYDEIKKLIEKAQQEPVRLETLNSFLHPDTPASEGNVDFD